MAIDTIIFNPNYNLYGFIKISFDYTMNGVLSKNIETTTFPIDLYTNNWTRLLLEIIYLIIVIVKTKDCIKSWSASWNLPKIKALVMIIYLLSKSIISNNSFHTIQNLLN